MNTSAEKLLTEARDLALKGEEFYRQCAAKITAAKDADHTLSNREIGEWFGRSETWVRELVTWSTSSLTSVTPYSGTGRPHQDRVATKKVLTEGSLEQVEQIISELPRERQRAIGAAAGNEYLKARQNYEEGERNLSPSQRKEREAVGDSLTESVRKAGGGFATLGIAGHIDQATEELRELVADSSLTPESWRIIATALTALIEEAQVAAAMVGLELDLQEV